ncbi:AAA family ATPase [Vibrio europaeus]|uniref:AAA family ATPase n=1 Tax=Vibrio europaeus TaxID=300876 RepID=UPI002340AF07|nr:AAA family ATPase [Vibrio europaeus]MDC5850536.1 AAA family ATPase [Vibrio europaeus]
MEPIVITGGPGAGKTTLLAALAEYGYATFSEGSRTLIEQQSQLPDGILPWTDLPKFARLCLRFMGDQKLTAQQSTVAFMDRAIPDIAGYLKVGGCEVGQEFLDQGVGYHSQVFVCRPETSLYVQDEVRPHSFEEALQIHQVLVETYTELGYQVIEVPWGTVAERVAFVRQVVDLDSGAES